MKIFDDNNWTQKKLDAAIKYGGIENVFKELCEYICEEELGEFLGYYCDNNNCFPEDDE